MNGVCGTGPTRAVVTVARSQGRPADSPQGAGNQQADAGQAPGTPSVKDLDDARQKFLDAAAKAFGEWVPNVVESRRRVNGKADQAGAPGDGDAGDLAGNAKDLAERYLGTDTYWPHRVYGADTPPVMWTSLDTSALRAQMSLLMGEVGRRLIDSGVEPRVQTSTGQGLAPQPTFGPRGSQAWRAAATDHQTVSWTGAPLWSDDMQAAADEYARALPAVGEALLTGAQQPAGSDQPAAPQPARGGGGAGSQGGGQPAADDHSDAGGQG
jgi:hypothetical protein